MFLKIKIIHKIVVKKFHKYYRYCHNLGHDVNDCRKRLKNSYSEGKINYTSIKDVKPVYSEASDTYSEGKLQTDKEVTAQQILNSYEFKDEKSTTKCYGCGSPGVIKSNCKNCKNQNIGIFENDLQSTHSEKMWIKFHLR